MSEFRIDAFRAAGLGEYAAQSKNAVPTVHTAHTANTATIERNATVSTKDSVDLNERKEKVQEAREALAKKQNEMAQQQSSAAEKQGGGFWGAIGGFLGGAFGALLGGPVTAILGGLFGASGGAAAAQKLSSDASRDELTAKAKEMGELQNNLLKEKEALDAKLEEIEAKKGRAPSAETTPERYVRTY